MVYRNYKKLDKGNGLRIFFAVAICSIGGIIIFYSQTVPVEQSISKPVITYTSNINNNIDTSNNLQPQQDAQHLPNKSSLSQTNAIELEHNLHMQINNFRAQNGLKLLAYDEQLAIIAREHSKDMAVNNYYDHTSPNGVGLDDRYKNVNYVCFGWKGENIQIQNNDNNLVENAFQIWINSPEHKDNILFTNFMKEGIGVYFNGNDVYITEDFC